MSIKRVMVVDDEVDLTWSISKHLAKDKEIYELITANSGMEALKILDKRQMDLVISDIRMPEISGLDLLLQIREKYPGTKVIIMTAYGSSEVQDEANKRGCFKYIEKPFEIQELRRLILDGVQNKKGFEGRISDFQLSDLIQMNCLGRLTNALKVQKGFQQGIIYFEDGNIVHAEMDGREGEDAFYEILSWEGGNFSVQRSARAAKETIIKGWQTLLLEGLRRADEKRNLEEQRPDSEENTLNELLNEVLGDLVDRKGIVLAAIIDINGSDLAARTTEFHPRAVEISTVGAAVSRILKQSESATGNLGLHGISEVMLEYGDGMLVCRRIGSGDDYFVCLTDSDANFGLVRMEIKKHIKKLQEILA